MLERDIRDTALYREIFAFYEALHAPGMVVHRVGSQELMFTAGETLAVLRESSSPTASGAP